MPSASARSSPQLPPRQSSSEREVGFGLDSALIRPNPPLACVRRHQPDLAYRRQHPEIARRHEGIPARNP
jgi:hypothetical protein